MTNNKRTSVLDKFLETGKGIEEINQRLIKMNVLGNGIVVFPSGRVLVSQGYEIANIPRATISRKLNNPDKFDESDKKYLQYEKLTSEEIISELLSINNKPIELSDSNDSMVSENPDTMNSSVSNESTELSDSNDSMMSQNCDVMNSSVSNESEELSDSNDSIVTQNCDTMDSSIYNVFIKVKNPNKGSRNAYYTNGIQNIEIGNNGGILISYVGFVYLVTLFDNPYANNVRSILIKETAKSDIQHDYLKEWHKATLEGMEECIDNCEPINGLMKRFKDRLLDDTKLMYKKELLEVIDKLDYLRSKVLQAIIDEKDDEFQTQINNRNTLNRTIESIMKEIQILDDIIIGSVNQPGNYKREDILKEIYPKLENETEGQYTMRCRKSAGKLNKLLEEADLITIKEHKQFSKDNKAKIVKKVAANDKNPWLFDSIVGQFGKESQPTFHLTAYGKELWKKLYLEAKRCLEEELDASNIKIDKDEFDAEYSFLIKKDNK